MSENSTEPDDTDPGRSVRLIFTYEGDDVRLLSQQRVDVAVPGFDLARAPREGLMAEVRTAEGEVLSRVPVAGARPRSAEVFPEEPGQQIVRVEAPDSGAFTVVVPAPQAAAAVSLLEVGEQRPGSSPPPPDQGGRALARGVEAVELGTFELDR